ncbi:MAG: protein kinase [Vicinamibacteria bacterium]|nr:protein kinase [Vicinamibacteria bacterium]
MERCPTCHAEIQDGSDVCAACGRPFVPAATPTLARGAIIASRYEILSNLGKGGMGMVFKAHDRVLDETVALKILRPDVAGAGEMLKRFRSEIKLARKVRHKNVCGIHEYGEEDNLQYIAMEFIAGTDLKRLLKKKGRMPVEDAFSVAIQLAHGLQAIHDVGIIHRDLKTANAMIDDLGAVRLMDFGIAKKYDAEGSVGATADGHIIGTPEYMSPEQARGERIDFRSDIYALGVMIFEIFTGQVPFHAETPIATIFKHLQDPPPLDDAAASGVPAALIPILAKMLAKDADARYRNARAVVEALRQARAATFPDAGATPIPGETLKPDEELETGTTIRPQTPKTALTAPAPTLLTPPARDLPQEATVAAIRGPASRALPWLLLPIFGLVGLALVAVAVWLWPGPDDDGGRLPAPTTPMFGPATPAHTIEPAPTISTLTTPAPLPTSEAGRRPSPAPRSTLRLGPVHPPPTPKPIVNGTLVIVVRPWAEVVVDGKSEGTTPMKPLALPAGRYSIILNHPGFRPVQRKVTVDAGRETRLEIDLNWEAVPR